MDRITTVSNGELERRWKLVRDHLEAEDIDALVAFSNEDHLGGTTTWLTDAPVTYRRCVIFHRAEPMTVVEHGMMGSVRSTRGEDPRYRGVDEVYATAEFQSVHYTQGYEAEIAAEVLNKRRYRRVALAGTAAMTYGFVTTLRGRLAGNTDVADATDFIDRCMAIKSPEEQELIRAVAAMQDEVFRRVCAKVKPGMRDFEITALAQYEGRLLGADRGILLGSSGPQGTFVPFAPNVMQGRTVGPGDCFSLLIENNGLSGYYTELARVISFGRASQHLVEAVEKTKEAQAETKKQFKPGARCADIFRDFNRYNRAHGLPEEKRIYAHGQGYNLVERPLIRDDETMVLEEGMNLAIHPAIASPAVFATTCDNYILGPDGVGESLHKTPSKVYEV